MKSFIYLDTDTVNSYIAQIDNGLKTLQTQTSQSSSSTEKQSSHTTTAEGEADFSILGKGFDAKLDYIYNHIKNKTNTNLYSDVETKVLHDNAFHQVIDYLNKNNLFSNENIEIGDFIKVKGEYHLLDLDYYKKLFDDADFIQMMNEPKLAELDKICEEQYNEATKGMTINRDIKRSSEFKEIENKVKQIKKETIDKLNNENKELQKQLSLLLKIFPYKSFICIDKYLVIFDEKYLREDIQKAPFKYGGEVNLVGYVTNTTHVNKISSFFSGPSDMINSILKSLFETSDDLFIVHPIALYYE